MKPIKISFLVLLSLAILWCITIPIQIVGSHETPINTHRSIFSRKDKSLYTPSANILPSNQYTFTNEKAILWWKIYHEASQCSGSDRATKAANEAVRTCYP
jgi:hypothetical protein